ncbi:MAG: O-antigen ligase family protein [Oscillospiraceae bacterium]|nr:O-antigen ligase family protein [Oscillospiraceae bacterium]
MQNRNLEQDNKISLACWVLCGILVIILGILPMSPPLITQPLRPIFIAVCFLLPTTYLYRMKGEKLQIVYMLYTLVTLVAFPLTGSSISAYISLLLFGTFYICVATRIWTAREIGLVINTIIAACTIYGIILLISTPSLLTYGPQRINFFAYTINRNTSAFCIVPGALCSILALLYCPSGKRRLVYAGTGIICSALLVIIACRSAFLSLAGGGFLIAWQRASDSGSPQEKFKTRASVILLFLIAAAALYAASAGTNSMRLFDLTDSTGRDEIWEEAWKIINEKPVFGGGFDRWANTGHRMATHNAFLTIMVASGYTGGILMALFIASVFAEALKIGNLIPVAFLAELVCHSYSEPGFDYFAYIPLVLAAMLMRFIQNQNRDLRVIFR